MLGYIDVRGPGPSPLFRFTDGAGLIRSRFVAQIREGLLEWTRADITVTAPGLERRLLRLQEASTTVSSKHWASGKARSTCNMYGSLAVSSRATPGC